PAPYRKRLAGVDPKIIKGAVAALRGQFRASKPARREFLLAIGHVFAAEHSERQHLFGSELRTKLRIEVASDRLGKTVRVARLHSVIDHNHITSPRTPHLLLALRTFLGPLLVACFAVCAMLKCSSFLPALIAAASQSGFSPRPAQVSLGFSGLRYFGATGPRAPTLNPLEDTAEVESRDSLPSSACRARRSSATLVCRMVST